MQMSAPMCLIENRQNRLHIHPETLRLLAGIQKPVVVVSIVGLYRTGKSYLMNKLAGKNSGFSLGSTVQANTKGIWMWCVPYPGRPNQTLVLLDTEGLGDVEKGSSQNDTWIFALAVLLSSTLVYNSMGTIDQTALEKLHFVTELSKHIKAKSTSRDSQEGLEETSEFVRFFPTFIWAVRDFTLQLERNGQPITEDDYLEHALELKKGKSKEDQMFNLPRKCIRLFFPTRKCFVFDRPTSRKNLPHLEKMQEKELEYDFVEQARQFCQYIYKTSQEKTLPGGHVVTGSLLAKLAETYVKAIQSGEIPCIENAVLDLAKIENAAALKEAGACYEQLMDQKLKLPTETLQELLEIHKICEKEALRVFMARAFKDDSRHFQVELMKTVESKKEEYCHKNEQESSRFCSGILMSLTEDLENYIKNGIYSRPGGHEQFTADLKDVEKRYHEQPKKGIMADKVLQEFFKGKESVSKAILQSDVNLTEKERETAAARAQAEAAVREQELQRQQLDLMEQKLEDQQQSYEMNLHQLKEKMEDERKKLLEEQNKMIESKLREQEAFLKEGFEKEANRLSNEIQNLKEENNKIKKPSWMSGILGVLTKAIPFAIPALVGKAFGAASKLFRR